MANNDDGRGLRPASARARSLMAAASLLGLSLGVGVANAAEGGSAADTVKPLIGETAARDGHTIKMDSSQIKGEARSAHNIKVTSFGNKGDSADAHHIKWTSDQIKGEDRSAHTIKIHSGDIDPKSLDGATHQIKLKGQ